MVGWIFIWFFGIPWITTIKKRMKLKPIPFFFNAQSPSRIFNLATQISSSKTCSEENDFLSNNSPPILSKCNCHKHSDDSYKTDGITGCFESQIGEK